MPPRPDTDRLAEASVDLARADRCGYPEVVFGEGKSFEQLAAILESQATAGQPSLVTRTSADSLDRLADRFADGTADPVARTFVRGRCGGEAGRGGVVAVVSAGTTDLPVAAEAAATAGWMGCRVVEIRDVGVAGPQRWPERLPDVADAGAIVVVAGMEAALASVVAASVAVPVFGVPTSVGYGAAAGGYAALMGMLSSCVAHVAVVNIDAGFKGGYLAGLVANSVAAGTGDGASR